MENQGRRDTAPELAVRRAVHERGLRYRVDRSPFTELRSRADLVFGPTKVAVYIDGCFWHGCPLHATSPRANRAWWREKIETNQARDARANAVLAEHGWLVVRFWEHEDPHDVADRIESIVKGRRANRSIL